MEVEKLRAGPLLNIKKVSLEIGGYLFKSYVMGILIFLYYKSFFFIGLILQKKEHLHTKKDLLSQHMDWKNQETIILIVEMKNKHTRRDQNKKWHIATTCPHQNIFTTSMALSIVRYLLKYLPQTLDMIISTMMMFHLKFTKIRLRDGKGIYRNERLNQKLTI